MTGILDVLVPANAEGTRATVLRWCKAIGDPVAKDEPLVELETDKVTVEIPAPVSGTLTEILKAVDAEVSPDEVLARLRLDSETASTEPAATKSFAVVSTPAVPGTGDARKSLSPSVRRLLQEHSLAARDIEGTGRDGRVTAEDVTRHLSQRTSEVSHSAVARSGTVVPHSAMRRRVAEHMVRSLTHAPHVTTLFEADLTRVLKHRSLHGAGFESRGTRLTLTAYFICACVHALRAHPEVNATFHEESLELHADVNIGVGTALGNKGLIVPVIHRAQSLSLFETAQRLNRLVMNARAGKLAPEDVRGGTFTISNHGVGGSLLAAPIVINQPQVAILGIGKVQRRVCVMGTGADESIAVRSMCYLTLTLDHRALDAFQANAFLGSVVSALEQWPDQEA
ncbi:MAG: 2-oxo acid dehydrogenase subunit E2 [Pseudomonadota bacterium]|nr:2-oxo acid dehydrogenase subunit E2 [Pseudomonadota bacterium]